MKERGNGLILLGAGVSVPAGLPTAGCLRQEILKKFTLEGVSLEASEDKEKRFKELCHYFVQFFFDTFIDDDFEGVISAIREIKEKSLLAGVPNEPLIQSYNARFVYLCQQFYDLLNSENNSIRWNKQIIKDLNGVAAFIDELLCKFVAKCIQEANQAARDLEYIEPLLKFCEKGIPIVTLNYDLLIEKACGSKYSCSIGFDRQNSSPYIADAFNPLEYSLQEGGIKLIKLQGSLSINDYINKRGEGQAATKGSQIGYAENPCLIIGKGNKLSVKHIYPQLIREFTKALDESMYVVTVGYSFGDSHVNSLLKQWMDLKKGHHGIYFANTAPKPSEEIEKWKDFCNYKEHLHWGGLSGVLDEPGSASADAKDAFRNLEEIVRLLKKAKS